VSASCEILNLMLGPLDLNLLGLVVHLDQVVLNITAAPGAGNLLGNLLCSVANLLNSGGPLSTLLNNVVSLLNQILAGPVIASRRSMPPGVERRRCAAPSVQSCERSCVGSYGLRSPRWGRIRR
jgi:hypothetical protein